MMMRVVDHPADLSQVDLGTVFSALANASRRRVVEVLLDKDDYRVENCTSLNLQLSKQTMTHHVKVMSDAGLIIETDHGNRCEVELRKDELDARFPGLLDLVRAGTFEV